MRAKTLAQQRYKEWEYQSSKSNEMIEDLRKRVRSLEKFLNVKYRDEQVTEHRKKDDPWDSEPPSGRKFKG